MDLLRARSHRFDPGVFEERRNPLASSSLICQRFRNTGKQADASVRHDAIVNVDIPALVASEGYGVPANMSSGYG
jgi:hypothetical protein